MIIHWCENTLCYLGACHCMIHKYKIITNTRSTSGKWIQPWRSLIYFASRYTWRMPSCSLHSPPAQEKKITSASYTKLFYPDNTYWTSKYITGLSLSKWCFNLTNTEARSSVSNNNLTTLAHAINLMAINLIFFHTYHVLPIWFCAPSSTQWNVLPAASKRITLARCEFTSFSFSSFTIVKLWTIIRQDSSIIGEKHTMWKCYIWNIYHSYQSLLSLGLTGPTFFWIRRRLR